MTAAGSPLDAYDLEAIDKAFGLDEETRAARNRLLATLAGVDSADALWALYRDSAIPPGAPLIQHIETRRAIFWAVSVAAAITSADPERMSKILSGVREFGAEELRGGAR